MRSRQPLSTAYHRPRTRLLAHEGRRRRAGSWLWSGHRRTVRRKAPPPRAPAPRSRRGSMASPALLRKGRRCALRCPQRGRRWFRERAWQSHGADRAGTGVSGSRRLRARVLSSRGLARPKDRHREQDAGQAATPRASSAKRSRKSVLSALATSVRVCRIAMPQGESRRTPISLSAPSDSSSPPAPDRVRRRGQARSPAAATAGRERRSVARPYPCYAKGGRWRAKAGLILDGLGAVGRACLGWSGTGYWPNPTGQTLGWEDEHR
jgi:hypothetical protein